AYREEAAPLISQLAGAPWGTLLVLYGEAVLGPDTRASLCRSIRETRSLGRTVTAIHLEADVVAPEVVRASFDDLYEETGVPHRFFDDLEEARAWIDAEIERASRG
ncbi:MAG: hypothetical protein AAGE01_09230, partial [Pseudomonadota bacterium]